MNSKELKNIKTGIELVIMYIDEEGDFRYLDPEVISTAAFDVVDRIEEIRAGMKRFSSYSRKNQYVKEEVRKSLDYALKLKQQNVN